jgi:cytochrome c oxidase cbb3-type subunit 4
VTAMDPTYQAFAAFAQTWGLAYFVVIFLAVVAYAMWPSRKQQFEEAARVPLQED